jgi:hypothetical protein
VYARLSIPSDVANGDYNGTVLVLADVSQAGDAGSGVSIGAQIDIEVSATGTQKLSASVVDVNTTDTEEGQPLQIKAVIDNTGNVQVTPQATVSVTGTVEVAASVIDADPVPADETRTALFQWDTARTPPGDYVAHVAIAATGLDLGKRDLPFRIVPRGTLTRDGRLEELKLVNSPTKGAPARIEADFVNTGQIESRATFVGEFSRDGKLIQAIQSPERLVPQGERATIDIFVDIPDTGSYTLKGKVNFEGKESATKELTFEVKSSGGGSNLATVGAAGGGAIALAAVVGFTFVWRKRRRHGHNPVVA